METQSRLSACLRNAVPASCVWAPRPIARSRGAFDRRRLSAVAAALLACSLTALCASAGASVRWLGTQTLGRIGTYPLSGATLAGVANGQRALAWNQNGIRLALAQPGRRFGRPIRISEASDSKPVLAIDARGDLVVAWQYSDHSVIPPPEERSSSDCCDHVRVAMVRPDGKVVSEQTLTPPGRFANVQAVAISKDGSTAAVSYTWLPAAAALGGYGVVDPTPTQLGMRMASFGHRFGRPTNLGSWAYTALLQAFAGRTSIVYAALGAAAEQEAVVSEKGSVISHRFIGGVLAGMTPLPIYYRMLLTLEREQAFGLDAEGDAAILAEEPSPPSRRTDRLQAMIRRRHGTFRTLTLATTPGELYGGHCSPALAVAPTGLTLAVWSACEGRSISVALGTIAVPGGTLKRVSGPTLPASEQVNGLACALGPGRDGLVVADVNDAGARSWENRGSKMIVFERSSSGHFGPPQEIPTPRKVSFFDEEPAQIATDKRGLSVVVWRGSESRLDATWFTQ